MLITSPPTATSSVKSLDLMLAVDAAKFHDKARIVLESIPDNDLIEVDDQIRNIRHFSAEFYDTHLTL